MRVPRWRVQHDLNEFNQCQTQLLPLRQLGLGSPAVHREFAAYKLLYQTHKQQVQELSSELAQMSEEELKEAPVQHALAVRNALVTGNYAAFFRLYAEAPNMGSYLLDGMLLRQRVIALTKMTKAYVALRAALPRRVLPYLTTHPCGALPPPPAPPPHPCPTPEQVLAYVPCVTGGEAACVRVRGGGRGLPDQGRLCDQACEDQGATQHRRRCRWLRCWARQPQARAGGGHEGF